MTAETRRSLLDEHQRLMGRCEALMAVQGDAGRRWRRAMARAEAIGRILKGWEADDGVHPRSAVDGGSGGGADAAPADTGSGFRGH